MQNLGTALKCVMIIILFVLTNLILAQEDNVNITKYDDLKSEMSEYVLKKMKKNNVVGLSIALVDDQDIIWSEGFGYADKEKRIKADSLSMYRIGSISKLFTALSAMQLAEQNLIHIDSAYTKYVPEFSIKTRYTGGELITTRNMLTHYSGIPCDYLYGWSTNAPISSNIKNLHNEYTCFKPNYKYVYSNTAISLVGYMIEKVTSEDFSPYIDRTLLKPLGMNKSSFTENQYTNQLLSKGYNHKGKEKEYMIIRDLPTGAMLSNAVEMSNFIKMIFAEGKFNDKTIVKSETLDEMFRIQNENNLFDVKLLTGITWDINNHRELLYAGKNISKVGNTKFFCAKIVLIPKQKLGVIVLTNSQSGDKIYNEIASKTLSLALEIKTGLKKPKQEKTKPKIVKDYNENFSKFSGVYNSDYGIINLKAKKNRVTFRAKGLKFELCPNTNKDYTLRMRLLGIPFTVMSDGLELVNIEGHNLIRYDSLVIVGSHCEITEVPEKWKNRCGKYTVINQDNNQFYIKEVKLSMKKDYMTITRTDAGLLNETSTQFLHALNDTEAIVPGFGHGQNETIYITTDENGNEILNISGFKLKKK